MSLPVNAQDNDNFLVFGSINTYRHTNNRGETETRRFIPLCLRWGRTEYHPEDQWLVEVIDMYRLSAGAFRTYALKDIQPR